MRPSHVSLGKGPTEDGWLAVERVARATWIQSGGGLTTARERR